MSGLRTTVGCGLWLLVALVTLGACYLGHRQYVLEDVSRYMEWPDGPVEPHRSSNMAGLLITIALDIGLIWLVREFNKSR